MPQMVALAEPLARSPMPQNKEEQALETIEEVIAEFGVRATIAACLRSSAGEEFERCGANVSRRVIQVILREIAFSKNPQLEAEIMALGAGILLCDNQTMGVIGAKHMITRQAVSKRVIAFCEKWKLPPSEFMRSEKDRKTYALTNKPRET